MLAGQVSFALAFAYGSPHCSMKSPPLVLSRWHWLSFQKLAEARWMKELTVHVAWS